MKKLFISIIILVLGLTIFSPDISFAQEEEVEIDFFFSKICPYCAKEKEFLNDLEKTKKKLLLFY